jgi:hypothetical protein
MSARRNRTIGRNPQPILTGAGAIPLLDQLQSVLSPQPQSSAACLEVSNSGRIPPLFVGVVAVVSWGLLFTSHPLPLFGVQFGRCPQV